VIVVAVILLGTLAVSVRSRWRAHGGHGDDPAEVEHVVREQLYGQRSLKTSCVAAEAFGARAEAPASDDQPSQPDAASVSPELAA
jgi:hypothetical protein